MQDRHAAESGTATDGAPGGASGGAICVCVRVPKSGSASLTAILKDGFAGRRIFGLPSTRNADGSFSALQRYRGARSRLKNLWRDHRTFSMTKAYERIAREAAPGDLIDGGHIDFASVTANIPRKLKLITILRDPAARALSEYNYSREGYFKKPFFKRFDSGILHKAAARYSFEGYLDFLAEHRALYGDIASLYVGWDGQADLSSYFEQNVFHAGTLERRDDFAATLSQKLGRNLAFPHANRTRKPVALDIRAAERTKIERLYARDFTLYEWVREHT